MENNTLWILNIGIIKIMKNKTLGVGLLCTYGITFVIVALEAGMTYYTAEGLYTLAGIAMLFFGIWGAIRLINS